MISRLQSVTSLPALVFTIILERPSQQKASISPARMSNSTFAYESELATTTSITPQQLSLSLSNFVLPSFVRKRIRPIPSLRRTCSQYLGSNYARSCKDSASSIYSETLIPRTQTDDASSQSSSTGGSTLIPFAEDGSRRSSIAHGLLQNVPIDNQSGVKWKFAYGGSSLLNRAVQEASSPEQCPGLTRKLYVDGLLYLIGALPDDLSEDELLRIRRALPAYTDEDLSERPSRELSQFTHGLNQSKSMEKSSRSITYAASTGMTFYLMFLINLLLPYIQLLLAQMYRYERRYRISDRLVNNGINAGRKSSPYLERSCNMLIITLVFLWKQSLLFAQDATEGIQDGVGRGKQKAGTGLEMSIYHSTRTSSPVDGKRLTAWRLQ
jgi:hypothetical protein